MNLFKRDIYKNLRPKKTNSFMGMNLPDFPSIKDIEYKDALIYPRFVFKDDEENNYYSLGGDNHNDLEDDHAGEL